MEEFDASLTLLQSQIAQLQSLRSNLATALLSSSQTRTRVERYRERTRSRRNQAISSALVALDKQERRNIGNNHRACAGATALKIVDPDPSAGDRSNVLGVTIEVFVEGSFRTPYYLLLARSPAHPSNLKLHHHTIPPFIPLIPLAAKFLPHSSSTESTVPTQDLHGLIRALRKELLSYHLRMVAIKKLRSNFGLPEHRVDAKPTIGLALNSHNHDEEKGIFEEMTIEGTGQGAVVARVVDVCHDGAGTELTILWSDGSVGRMDVSKNGLVHNAVVKQRNGGRLSTLENAAVGGEIESLSARLMVVD